MRFSDGLESLGNWYNKVTDLDDDAFKTVSATIYEKQEEIVTTLSIVPPMRLQNLSTQRSRPSVRSSMGWSMWSSSYTDYHLSTYSKYTRFCLCPIISSNFRSNRTLCDYGLNYTDRRLLNFYN